jgi:hypothetical protein
MGKPDRFAANISQNSPSGIITKLRTMTEALTIKLTVSSLQHISSS